MRSKRSLTRNVGNRGDHINRISMREYQHSGGDKNNSSNSQFLYVDENNSYDDNSPRSNKTTDLIESKYDSHSNVVTCDGCTVTSVDSNTESWLQSRNTNSSFNELSLHQGEKKSGYTFSMVESGKDSHSSKNYKKIETTMYSVCDLCVYHGDVVEINWVLGLNIDTQMVEYAVKRPGKQPFVVMESDLSPLHKVDKCDLNIIDKSITRKRCATDNA